MLTAGQEEGIRLKQIIKDQAMSQTDFGKFAEVEKGTVSKYLKGSLRIPSETVVLMHKKFRLNFEWFYCGTGSKYSSEKKEKSLVTNTAELSMRLELMAKKLESYMVKTDNMVRLFYSKEQN